MAASCSGCNLSKGKRTPLEWAAWAEATGRDWVGDLPGVQCYTVLGQRRLWLSLCLVTIGCDAFERRPGVRHCAACGFARRNHTEAMA